MAHIVHEQLAADIERKRSVWNESFDVRDTAAERLFVDGKPVSYTHLKQRADTINHKARAIHLTKGIALATKTGRTNDKNGTGIRQRKSYNNIERYD